MSNSPRASTHIPTDVIHRPLCEYGAGPAPSFPFALACARGAERRKAHLLRSGTSRCRAPCDRHARLPALHCGDFSRAHRASSSGPEGLPLTLSGQQRRCPSSDRVQPFKAAPSSGADGDRASWDGITSPACRRRRPRSADRTSPGDALSERGWCTPYVKLGGRQMRFRVCKVHQHCPPRLR